MADWSKPSVLDTYANFLKYINAKIADNATMFASAPTNPVDQSVRWNATTAQFERYSAGGANWGLLAPGGVYWASVGLAADPVSNMQAATKQYVDALKTSVANAVAVANTKMPITGGTFTNNITVDTTGINGGVYLGMNTLKNNNRLVSVQTSGVQRWFFGGDGAAENGSNTGTNFSIYTYADSGAYLGVPMTITRSNLQTTFAVRPSWGAIPWDSSNLPNPASANGGQTTNGDITLWQNQNVGGDLGRLHFVNATNGLNSYIRLNSSSGALEIINNVYNAVNFTFQDGGAFTARAQITANGDLRTYANYQMLGNGAFYDSNSAQRMGFALGDYNYFRGGGGVGNYSALFMRNDGGTTAIVHGNGDIYMATLGWLTGILNGKATANVFHHGASVANCGSGTSLSLTAASNTLSLTLSTVNCNCNCANCGSPSCFPAGSKVLMADGTWKVIEDVRVGELVAGPMGPVVIVALDRPVLGTRTLMTMGDDSLQWSDEHLLWARDRNDGREFWWGANLDRWKFEADTGHVGGVQDRSMLLEGPADYAHVDGFKSNEVKPVANADPYTQLYLPVTDGSPIIVNGYMVGARVSDYNFDYDLIDWELDRHYINGVIENACPSV